MKFKKLFCAIIDLYGQGGIIMGLLLIIDQYSRVEVLGEYFFICVSLVWGVVLAKDIFMGQSISKKLLGLQIIDRRTGLAPKPLITILRNAIVLPIFPLEVICYLVFDRRIGDFLFKTQVVFTQRKTFSQIRREIINISFFNILAYLSIGVGLAYIGLMIYQNVFFLLYEAITKKQNN